MKMKKLIAAAMSAALLLTGVGGSSVQVRADDNKQDAVSGASGQDSRQDAASGASGQDSRPDAENEASASGQDSIDGLSASEQYVAAMGAGWNLGNSFDGVDTDLNAEDKGEMAWGNPAVTKELIHSVKEKGYQSIRIPLTLYHRFTEEDGTYTIDPKWLARYKEVVDWAVEEGLYVMVNIHHDSWIWLKDWDGNTSSSEYIKFTQLWEQLAKNLAEEPEQVCFETINEPQFSEYENVTDQQRLDSLNQAAYDIIRKSGGNNAKRMIVMPTMNTNHADEKVQGLLKFMQSLNDPNLIATVHYYSEWVYSANLGITSFDEALGDDGNTPRKAADEFFNVLTDTFIKNGFGVVVGEYGLLGYDAGEDCLQQGEELKYYEYMGAKAAQQNGISLMFWDNGSGIDRIGTAYAWKKPLVGEMLQTSVNQRSSYATGLDTLYFNEKADKDLQIPLTLNGNEFTGIEGAVQGTDYIYDKDAAAVTLKRDFVNKAYDKLAEDAYGTFADLTFTFSAGAPWHQYLVKCAAVSAGSAQGTTADGIQIPVTYRGSRVRRATAYAAGGKVGPQSGWWNYLQYQECFWADDAQGLFVVTDKFFADDTVKGKDGLIRFEVQFYDGSTKDLWLNVSGDQVTSEESLEKKPSVAAVKVKVGKKKALKIKNVADKALVSYKTADKKIASVTTKGVVKGKKAGRTKVKVTVTQYGRTDTFTGSVQVSR